jgi:hypothetical protein
MAGRLKELNRKDTVFSFMALDKRVYLAYRPSAGYGQPELSQKQPLQSPSRAETGPL